VARSNSLGKSIVLLFLIVILALGGLLWFDFLGVIRVKSLFNPIYKALGWQRQTSTTATSSKPLTADLDQDRLDKQREALDLYREELEKRGVFFDDLCDEIGKDLAILSGLPVIS